MLTANGSTARLRRDKIARARENINRADRQANLTGTLVIPKCIHLLFTNAAITFLRKPYDGSGSRALTRVGPLAEVLFGEVMEITERSPLWVN
jgi:hypothetical protein